LEKVHIPLLPFAQSHPWVIALLDRPSPYRDRRVRKVFVSDEKYFESTRDFDEVGRQKIGGDSG
jgi:hypothetical protein